MAEALLNRLGQGRFKAFSAGSHPKGAVHPQALAQLRREGLPTDGFRSKSWDEFAGSGAPPLDLVVTVCDRAAAESCPFWPGAPARAHWSVDDPAALDGSPEAQARAFERAYRDLEDRIRKLVDAPGESREP
jgi:arsenate reductase (thioredoxin)